MHEILSHKETLYYFFSGPPWVPDVSVGQGENLLIEHDQLLLYIH